MKKQTVCGGFAQLRRDKLSGFWVFMKKQTVCGGFAQLRRGKLSGF